MDPMPSVAMNEFTPSLTTMNAFVKPMAIATTIPAMIAGATAQWLPFMRTIVRIPDTLAVAPTDRSYSPAASGIRTARPIIPVTACWAATLWSVEVVRNWEGTQSPNTMMNRAHR